ncbi:unnamed protein product [Linum tenue]|uniref:F-box domain-containing protein n=1 Tax=Linum tenue TaxID=586396 RepID=A0AAV0M006_9ROSI|nr:unnamed protein product [Linum tenue]
MKWIRLSSADKTNDLPPNVIERILIFLPVKDAAKTATLSTHWRHERKDIPQLNFNSDFDRIHEVRKYAPNVNEVV